MSPTRRQFLAAATVPLLGAATIPSALADGLVIEPLTPTVGQDTPYARFANQGPWGRPTKSVHMNKGKLTLDIYLPPNQPRGRVVVFSHAELLLPQVYENLLAHWASHGFIVIAPLHDDSVLVEGLKAHQSDASGGTWNLDRLIEDPKAWTDRATACRSVLDLIPSLEQGSGIRFMDERPIIVGHSFGAFAAQLLVNTKAWKQDGTVMEADEPRFYAAILMSPQGRGILGLRDGSWDGVDRPTMVMTGNGDRDATGQDPNVKIEPYAFSPPGNRHLAWFSTMQNTLWSGQQIRQGSGRELVFQDLLAVTTAFLTAYAGYDKDALALLSGDYFNEASLKRMSMYYR